jgi:hypothetical protein
LANWATLKSKLWLLEKDEVAQRNGNILGYFLLKQFFTSKYGLLVLYGFKINLI